MSKLLAVYLLINALTLVAADAAAQGKRQEGARPQQMKQEERQRMREDMRDVNRSPGRPERQQRSMTPEQREKLRRDVQDANRDLKKR